MLLMTLVVVVSCSSVHLYESCIQLCCNASLPACLPVASPAASWLQYLRLSGGVYSLWAVGGHAHLLQHTHECERQGGKWQCKVFGDEHAS